MLTQYPPIAAARRSRAALFTLLQENVLAKDDGHQQKETGELTALVDQILRIAGRAGELA